MVRLISSPCKPEHLIASTPCCSVRLSDGCSVPPRALLATFHQASCTVLVTTGARLGVSGGIVGPSLSLSHPTQYTTAYRKLSRSRLVRFSLGTTAPAPGN